VNFVDPSGLRMSDGGTFGIVFFISLGGGGGGGGGIRGIAVKIAKKVASGVLSKIKSVFSVPGARTPPFNPGSFPSISLGDLIRGLPVGIGVKVDPRTPDLNPNATRVGGVSNFLSQDPDKPLTDLPAVKIWGTLYLVFNSIDEAAFHALDMYNHTSRRINREFGGYICEVTSPLDRPLGSPPRYIYTWVQGREEGVKINNAPCPLNTRGVGDWHTHGRYSPKFISEDFSPYDRLNTNFQSQWGTSIDSRLGTSISYLGTPSRRILIFYPKGTITTDGTVFVLSRRTR
jgi:hypothetical protein